MLIDSDGDCISDGVEDTITMVLSTWRDRSSESRLRQGFTARSIEDPNCNGVVDTGESDGSNPTPMGIPMAMRMPMPMVLSMRQRLHPLVIQMVMVSR